MVGRVKGLLSTSAALFASERSARNVVWNLLGGVSTGAMMFLATPIYVSRLGLEGYGIVGLWLVLQVMIVLLDMGMGVSIVRAFAGAEPGQAGDRYRRDLLRTMEAFYWAIAIALTVAFALSANWMATHWLESSALSSADVAEALRLMAIALGIQFASVLYANGLSGLQAHGKMNALQVAGNVLRYGGGIAVLLWRADLGLFFVTQAVVAALQMLATRQVAWRMITAPGYPRAHFRLDLVQPLWRYSAGMALSTLAGVSMANADRIAISALLPTGELGKYAVAFTAAGMLQLGVQPFYRAFFPRFAELIAAGNEKQLRAEYFRSCRLLAAFVIPIGTIAWTFAPELLVAWLGTHEETVASVFRWLLIGVACSGLLWLPAALQQASGWTRLHASMMAGALVLGVPVMLWAIRTVGTPGAAAIWILHGVTGITIELWLMHRRLLVGDLMEWYRLVLLPPLLLTFPVTALSWWAMPSALGRWLVMLWFAVTCATAILLTLFVAFGRNRGDRALTVAESSTN